MDTSLADSLRWEKHTDDYGRVCRRLYRNNRCVGVVVRLPTRCDDGYLVNNWNRHGDVTRYPRTRAGFTAAIEHLLANTKGTR